MFKENKKYEQNNTGKLFLVQNLWNQLGVKRVIHHDTVYM